jgi:ABC-2 type transport system ATP-binding protein
VCSSDLRSPQNLVEVRLLDGVDGLAGWLTGRDGVSEIRADGNTVRFLLRGDEAAEAKVLRKMIERGFRVIAFGARRRTLEDVFMQVTKGLVQ